MFLAIRILLTESCNLACVFCHNEGQAHRAAWSPLDPVRLRTLIEAARPLGLRQIKFSGGEPTLHPRLNELVKECGRADEFDVVVISNGTDTDTLLQSHRLGARVSLNIPTADSSRYHALTKGRLAAPLATLHALRGDGADVSINSYVGSRPDRHVLDGLSTLAWQTGAHLKLLLPCQITARSAQLAAIRRYADALHGRGWTTTSETPFDSRWISRRGQELRVVNPWCPHSCRQVATFYSSLRLTARMEIVPCLSSSSSVRRSPLSTATVDRCRDDLVAARDVATHDSCPATHRLDVVRRDNAVEEPGVCT